MHISSLIPRYKKQLLLGLLVIFCLPFLSFAQTKQRLLIGLDPLKSAIHTVSGGYHFNPEIQYHFIDNLGISVEGIFVETQQSRRSRNIQNYQSTGSALKVGLLAMVGLKLDEERKIYFSLGLKYLRSRFQERGVFEVPGPYFGNYREPFERPSLRTPGLEVELAFRVETLRKVWLSLGMSYVQTFRRDWNTEDTPEDLRQLGIRYIPGVGRTIFPGTQELLEGILLHSKVFYQF